MPKGFTENEKKWIRARLLEQGNRQFSAYGLKKTNVGELAEAAGISKGAFYLFYESKEALFMDVAEQAEMDFRQEVLAAIELPGPSPRARLLAVMRRAFRLWKTVPILSIFTRRDYEILSQRIPEGTIQEHMNSDRAFAEELVRRCRQAGIPITAQAEEISGLLYTLFFTVLHEDDFGPGGFAGPIDILIELVAAYCLGELELAHSSAPLEAGNNPIITQDGSDDPAGPGKDEPLEHL